MAQSSNSEKQHAHKLLDQVPATRLGAVVELLESIVAHGTEPDSKFPVEDELISEAETRAVEESNAWLKARGGKGIPHEEVLAEFGLTLKDFSKREE